MKEIKFKELENLDELDELEYNYELENFDETTRIQLASFLRKTPKKGMQEIKGEIHREELLQQEELRQQEALKKKRRAKKARIRKRRRKIFFFSFIIFYFCSLFLCYSFATKRAEERNNSTESHWYYDTNEETEAILVSTKPQCGLVDFLSFIPNFNNDNFFISHIY